MSFLIHNQDKDFCTINVHSTFSNLTHNVVSSNKLICLKKILKQQQRKRKVTTNKGTTYRMSYFHSEPITWFTPFAIPDFRLSDDKISIMLKQGRVGIKTLNFSRKAGHWMWKKVFAAG